MYISHARFCVLTFEVMSSGDAGFEKDEMEEVKDVSVEAGVDAASVLGKRTREEEKRWYFQTAATVRKSKSATIIGNELLKELHMDRRILDDYVKFLEEKVDKLRESEKNGSMPQDIQGMELHEAGLIYAKVFEEAHNVKIKSIYWKLLGFVFVVAGVQFTRDVLDYYRKKQCDVGDGDMDFYGTCAEFFNGFLRRNENGEKKSTHRQCFAAFWNEIANCDIRWMLAQEWDQSTIRRVCGIIEGSTECALRTAEDAAYDVGDEHDGNHTEGDEIYGINTDQTAEEYLQKLMESLGPTATILLDAMENTAGASAAGVRGIDEVVRAMPVGEGMQDEIRELVRDVDFIDNGTDEPTDAETVSTMTNWARFNQTNGNQPARQIVADMNGVVVSVVNPVVQASAAARGATALDVSRGLSSDQMTGHRSVWRTLYLPEIEIHIRISNADGVEVHTKTLLLKTFDVEEDDDTTVHVFAPVEVNQHGNVRKRAGCEAVMYTSILDADTEMEYEIGDPAITITNQAFHDTVAFTEKHLPSVGEGSYFCLEIIDVEQMKATREGDHMGPPKISETRTCTMETQNESGDPVNTVYTVCFEATLVSSQEEQDPGEDDSETFRGTEDNQRWTELPQDAPSPNSAQIRLGAAALVMAGIGVRSGVGGTAGGTAGGGANGAAADVDDDGTDAVRIVPGVAPAGMEPVSLWEQSLTLHAPRCCAWQCEDANWMDFYYPASWKVRHMGREKIYTACRCEEQQASSTTLPVLRNLCQVCFQGNAGNEEVQREIRAFKERFRGNADVEGCEFFNKCPHCRTVGPWKRLELTEAEVARYRVIADAEAGVAAAAADTAMQAAAAGVVEEGGERNPDGIESYSG